MIRDPKLIHEALGALGPVTVYFAEFQMMHWQLHLMLTGRDFGDVKAHLFLANTGFISGPTLCQSSKLSLEAKQDGNQKVLVLSGEPSGLKVEAVYVSLAEPGEVEWPPPLGQVPEYEP